MKQPWGWGSREAPAGASSSSGFSPTAAHDFDLAIATLTAAKLPERLQGPLAELVTSATERILAEMRLLTPDRAAAVHPVALAILTSIPALVALEAGVCPDVSPRDHKVTIARMVNGIASGESRSVVRAWLLELYREIAEMARS